MAHTEKLCAYCAYMDKGTICKGKYYCEHNHDWRYADDDVARECRKFCEIFWRDIDKAKSAVEESKKYKRAAFYIVTAIAEILGLRENSFDIGTFRDFRDDIVDHNPDYTKKLIKYDIIGPVIADKLRSMPNRVEVAEDLYNIYIKGCVQYIEKGNLVTVEAMGQEQYNGANLESTLTNPANYYYNKALDLYAEMVERLSLEFDVQYDIGSAIAEKHDEFAQSENSFCIKPISNQSIQTDK